MPEQERVVVSAEMAEALNKTRFFCVPTPSGQQSNVLVALDGPEKGSIIIPGNGAPTCAPGVMDWLPFLIGDLMIGTARGVTH